VSQECYHTLSVVKYMGKENDFAGVAVSPANFNSFAAQLLTQKQHRIEVRVPVCLGGAAGATLARTGADADALGAGVERDQGRREGVEHRAAGVAGEPRELRGRGL